MKKIWDSVKSDKKTLRQFGLLFAFIFLGIGLLLLWKGKAYQHCFLGTSGVLFLISFALPILLLPFQKLWMMLALVLNYVVTRVILTILYYIIVTPIGLLARIFGQDLMDRKFDRTAKESYWIHKKKPFEKETLKDQY